jgi:hypothetical protein
VNITLERTYDLTPEWNENKKEEKPIIIHMRLLSTAERDKLMDFTWDAEGSIKYNFDRPGLFVAGVTGIDNLMVNGETLKDARAVLSNAATHGLFMEVVTDIIARNRRVDLKNS